MTKLVSVVVPTFNRREFVRRAVDALLRQTYPTDSCEIIVSCNGCTDGTQDALRAIGDLRLVVLDRPAANKTAALNAAATRARGEILVFLDDDMIAGERLIEAHVNAQGGFGAQPVAVTGHVSMEMPENAGGLVGRVAAGFEEFFRELSNRGESRVPSDLLGGNFSIPRDALIDVGCFNTSYVFQRDDFELGTRWIERGYTIRYCPDASAQMQLSIGADELIARAGTRAAADLRLAREHPWCVRWLPFFRILSQPSVRLRWHLFWLAAPVLTPLIGLVRKAFPRNGRLQDLGYASQYCLGLRQQSASWNSFMALGPK